MVLVTRLTKSGRSYRIDGKRVPSVTTVIGTLDKPALLKWYASMAANRVVDRWDELLEMAPSERLKFVERAPWDRVKAASLRGTEIHALGHKLAMGAEVEVPPEHAGPVNAYAKFLDRWEIEPIASETPCAGVSVPGLEYAGTADLWAKIGKRGGATACIDLKTGSGVWSESALQVSGYRFSDLLQPERGVEIPTPETDLAYVAHILPDAVEMMPIQADEARFRTFQYLLAVHLEVREWKDAPLVGEAERP